MNFIQSIPSTPQDQKHWGQLTAGGLSFALAEAAQQHPGFVVAVVPDFLVASNLERELKFYLGDAPQLPLLHFPDWETLPYDQFSPHQDIISERLTTLYQLPHLKRGILIVPISTLMHRLCPPDFLLQRVCILKVGDLFDLENMRTRLIESGYQHAEQVSDHGEFAIRGSILDLFPMGASCPYRIDLLDDALETIRMFDPETQRSTEQVDSICLLPAREFALDESAIALFRSQWRASFSGDPRQCLLYVDVSQGLCSPGLEYFLPLFHEKTATLFDYLPKECLWVRCESIQEAAHAFWKTVEERYEQYRHDIQHPILEPPQIFIPADEVLAQFKLHPQLFLQKEALEPRAGRKNGGFRSLPDVRCDVRAEVPMGRLIQFLQDFKGRVLFAAETVGRREVFLEQLAEAKIIPHVLDSWRHFLDSDLRFAMTVAPLEQGLIFPDSAFAVITEADLLGPRVMQQRRRKGRGLDAEQQIRNLTELKIGSPVVHLDHGVGRYLGLTHLLVEKQEAEFITIEYAGGDKLYVPVADLHLISRYSAVDLEHAPLHSLGGDRWKKEKKKAREQIRDVAVELLDIYAKREAKSGFKHVFSKSEYEHFVSLFPFEETLDQTQAIEQVIGDLTSERPMDRVVCGDVGFGKTEVAMRAAFIVAQQGKQVGVLVPTTLLAQQHHQTFRDRFAEFPIRIEVISRFRSKKEVEHVLSDLAEGKVDIILGTHRLLQSDVRFKDPGLLIIDEEHRFGVQQKEKLKSLRAEVDILTLTATPIPRTLNMAMGGIRDLSIIATPPAKRLSVKTFVREYHRPLIQEAIQRELRRGGQVFYLHNSVDTIEKTARELETLVPEARIVVAHGQMPERALEHVMREFYHRHFNILVCTTIIETGIDIPTANTMIIDRADKMGLAQLHQLRGRVGRSHHQAYAFCLTPPKALMTADAEKRLEAIANLEVLGAGFTLATHDLEIRGAGELLGQEQSGHIQSIGYHLYMELLEHAVKALQEGRDPSLLPEEIPRVEIDLQIPALIPNDYIPDVHMRLQLYKRISGASDWPALQELQVEMMDRFGTLKPATQNLFHQMRLKLLCEKLGVRQVKVHAKGGTVDFYSDAKINPSALVKLIQTQSKVYQMKGPTRLQLTKEMTMATERLEFLETLLQRLEEGVTF